MLSRTSAFALLLVVAWVATAGASPARQRAPARNTVATTVRPNGAMMLDFPQRCLPGQAYYHNACRNLRTL